MSSPKRRAFISLLLVLKLIQCCDVNNLSRFKTSFGWKQISVWKATVADFDMGFLAHVQTAPRLILVFRGVVLAVITRNVTTTFNHFPKFLRLRIWTRWLRFSRSCPTSFPGKKRPCERDYQRFFLTRELQLLWTRWAMVSLPLLDYRLNCSGLTCIQFVW